MATHKNRIIAVIDPTRREQWALKKALSIASSRDDLDVCAFLCVYTDKKCDNRAGLRAAEVDRHRQWLDTLLAEYAESDVRIDSTVEWGADWLEAICAAGTEADVVLVVKRVSGRQRQLASSDRQLIRKLGNALLLVKSAPADEVRKILIAVDFNAEDESHKALNEAIMSLGLRMRGTVKSTELHSISAYSSSDRFIHPPDIAKVLGIDRSQAIVRYGPASEVIPEAANALAADLVIVGNVARAGLPGLTSGNTAEKILTDIASDVLVLVAHEIREQSAA